MAHSPILRGLILGMSFGDVARMFPGIEMKNNPDGYSVLNLEFVAGLGVTGHDRAMEGNYIGGYHVNRSLREGFADVDKLEIHFLDEKAILIDVTYSGGERWTDIGDFAEASAKGLEITATWVPTNGTRLTHNGEESYPDSVSAGIQCEGFSVVALLDSINRPHLQLRADQNIATFLQRLRDRRQRQRDSFKP
jgi:hypothetical protein